MLSRRLPELYEAIEPDLYRFRRSIRPAFDPQSRLLVADSDKTIRFTTSSSCSATVLAMGSVQRVNKPPKDAAAEAEAVRLHRLREDAQRPMSVNLAETIALSHALLKMAAPVQR